MDESKRIEIYGKLKDLVGSEIIFEKDSEKIGYSLNRNWYTRTLMSLGQSIPVADFVVHPESTQQVSQILSMANEEKIPVTTYAGGTSGMGGNVPRFGGIVIDLKKMDKMLQINRESLFVSVQTGIGCWELEDELNRLGYTTGHIPASHFCACIGGSLALRAAGRLSTGYGKIEDMVLGLEVVLPDGEIFRTRPVPRHATGPDLNQLFIGSEGSLGIMTEAVLKIYPYPEERRFRAILFQDLDSGLQAMRRIMQTGLSPIMGRLYDERETATLFKDTWGIEEEGAYLAIGFDGPKSLVEIKEDIALEICNQEGGKDFGGERGMYWWNHRFDDYYPSNKKDVERYQSLLGGRLAGGTIDICAPYDKIVVIHREIHETFKRKYGEKYSADSYGHFSHWYIHGSMTYCRWHLREVPQDMDLIELYDEVWDTLVPVVLENGGIIEHHHGVGRLLGRFLEKQYGSESFNVLKKIKKALDPNNIMNPGVMGLGEE